MPLIILKFYSQNENLLLADPGPEANFLQTLSQVKKKHLKKTSFNEILINNARHLFLLN